MKKGHWTKSGILALTLMLLLLLASEQAMATPKSAIQSLDQMLKHYDSTRCAECHGEIYEQWSRSHHARSMMGLNNFSFMSKYLKKGPLSVKSPRQATLANFSCAKCHLPQLLQNPGRSQATIRIAGQVAQWSQPTILCLRKCAGPRNSSNGPIPK